MTKKIEKLKKVHLKFSSDFYYYRNNCLKDSMTIFPENFRVEPYTDGDEC